MRIVSLDYKNIEKINNKQPKERKGETRYQSREELGLLRVPADPGMSNEESRTMQQRHNINHALYYLSMISNSIIQGRKRWADAAKAERIIDHLSCCQEFLAENEGEVRAAVRLLLQNLENHRPSSLEDWAKFVRKNWVPITTLASKYGSKEISFPEENLEKISDVAQKKQFLKTWWWKVRTEKLQMRLKKLFKEMTK